MRLFYCPLVKSRILVVDYIIGNGERCATHVNFVLTQRPECKPSGRFTLVIEDRSAASILHVQCIRLNACAGIVWLK